MGGPVTDWIWWSCVVALVFALGALRVWWIGRDDRRRRARGRLADAPACGWCGCCDLCTVRYRIVMVGRTGNGRVDDDCDGRPPHLPMDRLRRPRKLPRNDCDGRRAPRHERRTGTRGQ